MQHGMQQALPNCFVVGILWELLPAMKQVKFPWDVQKTRKERSCSAGLEVEGIRRRKGRRRHKVVALFTVGSIDKA